MHIQQLPQALKYEGEGRPPLPFFENWKCPDFGKKDPEYVHLWAKFSIQNVVLRAPRRKISKMFPCVASFPSVFHEMFMDVP